MDAPPTSTNESTQGVQRGGVPLRTCAIAAGAGTLCGAIAVLFRLALGAAAKGDAFVLAAANASPDTGWVLLMNCILICVNSGNIDRYSQTGI